MLNTDDPDWLETTLVSRVVLDQGQGLIRLQLPDSGAIAPIFTALSSAGIQVGVIAQTQSWDGLMLAFTVHEVDRLRAANILCAATPSEVTHSPIAKISLEGVGVNAHSTAAASLFDALASASVEVEMITTSARVISVVVDLDHGDDGFSAICRAFGFPDDDVEQS